MAKEVTGTLKLVIEVPTGKIVVVGPVGQRGIQIMDS